MSTAASKALKQYVYCWHTRHVHIRTRSAVLNAVEAHYRVVFAVLTIVLYWAFTDSCVFHDLFQARVLCMQVKYPENFFLLRGNHECASINRIYGFYDECKRRYNIRLWRIFTDCFNCLPVAALIDEKVACNWSVMPSDTCTELV